MATCPTCGAEELGGQKFCASCGSPTTNVNTLPAPPPYLPAETASLLEKGPAGFWIRFLGFFIDGLLLYVIIQLPLHAVHVGFATSVIIVTATTFLYASLLIGYNHGQTLGMRAVSVRCVDEDGISAINYQRAARRAAAYNALVVIASVYHLRVYQNPTIAQKHLEAHDFLILFALSIPHFLDLLWVAWDKNKQTLHDKFAHTIVVKAK